MLRSAILFVVCVYVKLCVRCCDQDQVQVPKGMLKVVGDFGDDLHVYHHEPRVLGWFEEGVKS